MPVTANEVKQLHLTTGAGYMEAKRALERFDGDAEQAALALRSAGAAIARKKEHRQAGEGRIEIYAHTGERIGAMLELRCETDFAAATPAFRALARNLALQVAAMNPAYIAPGDVPAHIIAEETEKAERQARLEQKPAAVIPRIVEGKLKKYYSLNCLLEQPFIKDDSHSVRAELTACIAALKENVTVRRFVRYEVDA